MKTLAVEKAAEAIVTVMRVWYVTIGLLYPLAWVKSVHRCMFVNNNNNVTSGQPKQLPHFRLSKQEKGIIEIYCTRQIEAAPRGSGIESAASLTAGSQGTQGVSQCNTVILGTGFCDRVCLKII